MSDGALELRRSVRGLTLEANETNEASLAVGESVPPVEPLLSLGNMNELSLVVGESEPPDVSDLADASYDPVCLPNPPNAAAMSSSRLQPLCCNCRC